MGVKLINVYVAPVKNVCNKRHTFVTHIQPNNTPLPNTLTANAFAICRLPACKRRHITTQKVAFRAVKGNLLKNRLPAPWRPQD